MCIRDRVDINKNKNYILLIIIILLIKYNVFSSVGRTLVSKTRGRGFESYKTCNYLIKMKILMGQEKNDLLLLINQL